MRLITGTNILKLPEKCFRKKECKSVYKVFYSITVACRTVHNDNNNNNNNNNVNEIYKFDIQNFFTRGNPFF